MRVRHQAADAVNGIVPDFQIEVENIDVYRQIEQVAEAHDISDVTLLCSVTCERDALEFFDNVVFFMRGSLSPYPIWHLTEEQTLRHCNPTVSNAGLSFAQEIGSNEIYLFGVDMGSMDTDPEVHHSKDAYYYTEGAVFNDERSRRISFTPFRFRVISAAPAIPRSDCSWPATACPGP